MQTHSITTIQALIQNISDMILIMSAEGLISYESPSWSSNMGYRPGAFIGKSLLSILHPEDLPFVFSDFKGLTHDSADGIPTPFRLRKADGSWAFVEALGRNAVENPSIRGVVVTIRDISRSRQSEEVLRRSEERYRNILNNIDTGYFEVTLKGDFTFFNRALIDYLGYPEDEMIGLNYRSFLDEEERARIRDIFFEVYQTGESRNFTWRIIRKNGARAHAMVTVYLIQDDQGEAIGFRGTSQEVTDLKEVEETLRAEIAERRKAERELQLAKEAADEANRYKGEFLANMSHEIRTPLNAIIGMTELALDREKEEEKREILLTANHEAERLLQLINDTLVLSKIEAGHFDLECIAFDLAYLMDDISGMFALQCEQKDLDFLSYVEPGTPTLLQGDPGRLRQILVNLVGNAVKFTDEGEVSVFCSVIDNLEDSAVIRFAVRDTGIGIPVDKQKKIFESFTQADGSVTRKYGGTGLGTTISEQLVELMGGSIQLESEEGRGSNFWFDLSLLKQAGQTASAPAEHIELQGARVLVADDHHSSRMVLTGYLTSWGCEVQEAGDGAEALALLAKADAEDLPFDLVLMDRQIRGMGGFELAKAIMEHEGWRSIPLLLITSVGQLGDGSMCRNMGIRGYLTKPVKKTDLERTIMKILASPQVPDADADLLITRHSLAEERHKQTKILVVDDYGINRVLAVKNLHDAGYTVDEAENGKKAVEAWRLRQYDLILMDIQMPVMDGYDAARMIRELESSYDPAEPSTVWGVGPRVPIIAVTAYAVRDCMERCIACGMDAVLTKPLKRQDLLDTVARMLGMGRDENGAGVPEGSQTLPGSDSVFNYARALDEFGNDPEFLNEVASEFIKTAASQVQTLMSACSSGRSETLHRAAHSIKGGAANLRAMELSAAARAVEEIGESGDLAGCPEAIEKLQIELNRFRAALEKQFQFHGREKGTTHANLDC